MTREAKALAGALAVYLAWVAATGLLERLPGTLLHPQAVGLRLAYVGVANLILGIVAPVWLIRSLVRAGHGKAGDFGFSGAGRTFLGAAAGAAAGYLIFALQQAGRIEPTAFLNVFFQVWAVSVAEIVVCWGLVGTTVFLALRPWSRAGAWLIAAGVASVLFGAYHFAHSAPFNEPRMVLFLTGIGLATSAWRFVSRDLYGSAVFHNFFGVTGVLAALNAGGAVPADSIALPLAASAAAVTAALIFADFIWIRRPGRG